MTAIIGPVRPYDNNLTFAITFLTVVDLAHLHMRKCHEYIDFNRDCASQGYREKTQSLCESETLLCDEPCENICSCKSNSLYSQDYSYKEFEINLAD